MFIDKARIFITAGCGGDGCISFRREKFVPLGGPDGGNGGKGGDIYLETNPHLTTLLDLTYKSHYKAESGWHGGPSNKYGRGAPDLTIKIPVGTVVYRDGATIADMAEPGLRLLVARGGRGGRGNASFKTGRHTAPRIKEKGEPGESISLDLELKLIADVGLVGFPNAGKSTLLSRISAARPKIADYPFTTLSPNLGVVNAAGSSFVVADIPGLIEGAHAGKGIGDEFLRHIQRTRVLVHIVDIFGFGGNTAYQNYRVINRELAKFSKGLLKKPMIVAANKTDLTGSDAKISQFKRNFGQKKFFTVSAAAGGGIKELITAVAKALKESPPAEDVIAEPVRKYVYKADFTVEKREGLYIVSGDRVEKLCAMTDFVEEESIRRFQNILKKIGVEKELEAQGIAEGDTVRIGKQEFEFRK